MVGKALVLATLSLALLLSSRHASTDIVFVDCNASSSEVDKCRSAAAARGERCVVVPDDVREQMSPPPAQPFDRARLRAILAELDQQNELMVKTSANDPALLQIGARIHALQAERERLIEPYRVNAHLLDLALTQVESRHAPVTSIVFSGHSGGQEFTGWMGGIGQGDIDATFSRHEASRRSVRGVYTWGCFTGEEANVVSWLPIFPNSEVNLGFAGEAPGKKAFDASSTILENALLREQQASTASDLSAAGEQLSELEAGKTVLAGIYGRCYYVGTWKSGVKDHALSAARSECSDGVETLREQYESVWRPFRCACDPTVDPPPAQSAYFDVDTSASRRLRELYDTLQRYRGCEGLNPVVAALQPETVANMIHFHDVARNFGVRFCGEIARANAILPPEVRIPDLVAGNPTRRQVIEAILRLERYQSRIAPAPVCSELALLARTMRRFLGDLDAGCIPRSWHYRPENTACAATPDATGVAAPLCAVAE